MKCVVNHNGICSGYAFKMGVETDLPIEVIHAIGVHNVKMLEAPVNEMIDEAPKDKMIRRSVRK